MANRIHIFFILPKNHSTGILVLATDKLKSGSIVSVDGNACVVSPDPSGLVGDVGDLSDAVE